MEVLEAVQGNCLQPPWEDSFEKVGDAFGSLVKEKNMKIEY